MLKFEQTSDPHNVNVMRVTPYVKICIGTLQLNTIKWTDGTVRFVINESGTENLTLNEMKAIVAELEQMNPL